MNTTDQDAVSSPGLWAIIFALRSIMVVFLSTYEAVLLPHLRLSRCRTLRLLAVVARSRVTKLLTRPLWGRRAATVLLSRAWASSMVRPVPPLRTLLLVLA